MAGKQAKILNANQQQAVLGHLAKATRHPVRNRVIFLLSMKAGLRAKEIASLRWRHVCDAEGKLTSEIVIEDKGSKGKSGGRTVPTNKDLFMALADLRHELEVSGQGHPQEHPIVKTERNSDGVSSQVIVNLFQQWYQAMGYEGLSSHSGRRTFITNAAKKITTVGGSLRDIQQLAGHKSLQTTQRYIEGSTDAKKRIVDIV